MSIRNLLQLVYIWELTCWLLSLFVRNIGSVNIKLCRSSRWQSFTKAHSCAHSLSTNTLSRKMPRESACPLVARKGAGGLRAGRLSWKAGREESESINSWHIGSVAPLESWRMVRNALEFKGCLLLSARNSLYVWHYSPRRCSCEAVSARWIQLNESFWKCPRGN